MTHKISKIKYLGLIPHKKVQAVTLGEGDVFQIGDKFEIKNREELYVALIEMDEADYASYIGGNKKEFLLWMKLSLKDPTLAKKFKKASREDMISLLEKVVDKEKLPHNKEFLERKKEEEKKEEEAKAFQKDEEKSEEKKDDKKGKKNKKNKKLFSRKKNKDKSEKSSNDSEGDNSKDSEKNS